MAGLLGSTSTSASVYDPRMFTPENAAPTGTAAQINGVEDWQNSADQSVAGHVQKITAADSPLMQQARTSSLQNMNQRGLVNSSIANTAGQSAVLSAALPMAQQDAATASNIAKYGADIRNDANKFNVQSQNTMASQNLGNANQAFGAKQQYDYTLGQMDKAQQNQLQTLGAQYNFDIGKMDKQLASTLATMTAEQQNNLAKMAAQQGYNLETMDAQQINDLQKLAAQIQGQKDVVATQTEAAKDVASIEAQYKSITQGSQSASTIMGNMQSSINAITLNTTMDAAAKTAAIADIRANAEESLQLIGALAGDIDLQSYISQIGLAG